MKTTFRHIKAMDFQEVFTTADAAILEKIGRHLSDPETAILKGAWQGQSYEKIAETAGYSPNYLQRDVGRKLWKQLSDALDEEVSKTNFRTALERRSQQVRSTALKKTAPSTKFESPEGQVPLRSSFYIERPPVETLCYQAMFQPGALIRIKAPKRMGKTSLLDRILDRAVQQNYRTARLDLGLADTAAIDNLDIFLRWFCAGVGRRLKLPDRIADYWHEVSGSNDNCTAYFEEYLLLEQNNPLVLGLDNIDRIFSHKAVAQDFFALLRAWHEAGNRGEVWQQLRLVIAYSTEVYIPLDINLSPFNVGQTVELPEFSLEQLQGLAHRYGLSWSESEVQQLMAMVGGHPYLARQMFHHCKLHPQLQLVEVLQTAATEAGIYAHYLRHHFLTLQTDTKLAAAMKQVVDAVDPVRVGGKQAFQLESMGLIRRHGNAVIPRCKLYRLYFQESLEGIG